MKNFKSHYLKKTLSMVLAVIMMITLVPLGVFAVSADGSNPTRAIDATGSDPNATQIYRGNAWIENKAPFSKMDDPDDKPIKGLTVYLQWMNTKGIVSPIYKTKTQKDGTYVFDLSKDVELATGETASFKLSEGGKFLVRTWVDNPDPKKYSVVKNGDMFGGAFHNRLTRKQESWDFTIGIERIVNANVQLSERPFIEKWLAKPENEWVRDTEGDGTWASRPGSAGVASGLVWNEVGEIIGGSPNEYLYLSLIHI